MLTHAKQLIESYRLTEPEFSELTILSAAVEDWQKKVKESPVAKNFSEWDAAKKALANSVREIWPRYFPDEPLDQVDDSAEVLLSQTQAKNALRSAGFKVSDGKMSNDWGDKVPVQRGGLARVSAVIQYSAFLRGDSEGSESLANQKMKEEIRKLTIGNERAAMENRKEDSRWMLREDSDIQAAALAGLLKDTVGHHLHNSRTRLIHVAGGDAGRSAELGAELENILNTACNEVANSTETEIEIDRSDDRETRSGVSSG